jgi:hypothetical protein
LAAPHVDIAIKNLKMFCDGKTVRGFYHWKVSIAIGSGKTSSELDTWFAQAFFNATLLINSIHFIVAGDDFYSVININGKILYMENDFRQYDRTQGAHALESCMVIENILGMPRTVLVHMYTATFRTARYENKQLGFRMGCPMPIQRATGGPDTTLGNSINNITACLYALRHLQPHQLVEHYADEIGKLGFISKVKTHVEPDMGTFLKGWWIAGKHWLPLPSQVLKLGKILTDPRIIYPKLVPDHAWKQAARAMALGFGTVPLDYPILGALLKRYLSLADNDDVIELRMHKTRIDKPIDVDRNDAVQQICERYGLSPLDIEEMEDEIATVPFPGRLSHKGFSILAEKDYG